MAPSGGFPSQPTFLSAVVTGNIQFGSASTAGTISGGNFNGQTVTGSTALVGGSLSATSGTFIQNVTMAAPSSGTTSTITSNNNNGNLLLNGLTSTNVGFEINITRTSSAAGIGQGPGIQFNDGTVTHTVALQQSANGLTVFGFGSSSWVPYDTFSSNGNITFGLPVSGPTVTATANAGDSVFVATTKNAGIAYDSTAAASTQTSGLGFGQVGQTHWQIYQPAASSDFRVFGAADRFTIDSAGNVAIPIDLTIGSPTGGPQGTGSVNAVKLFQQGAQVPKFSYGAIVEAGVAGCGIAPAGTAANLNLASCASSVTGTAIATFTSAYANPPTCTSTVDSSSSTVITVVNTAGNANVSVTNSVAGVATNEIVYVICVGT